MAIVDNQLVRGLTLTDSTAIVVGSIIGTGIFVKAAVMTQQVGTPAMVLSAWAAAGLLSLAGALTYSELGTLLPEAGGDYVYLRTAYGSLPAFLYGWMFFVVAAGGGIAALSTVFATFLSTLLPINTVWAERTFQMLGNTVQWQFGMRQVVAVAVIIVFSAINCFSVAFGGRVQTALTAAKILGIAVILVGVLFFSRTATWTNVVTPLGTPQWSGFQAFGAAMVGALYAYIGWDYLGKVAGEVQNPARNIPRALIAGVVVVIVIYGLANLAYFYALPLSEVATSNSTTYRNALPVATKAAQTFLGPTGVALVSIALLVSTIGALNGSIMAASRVPFAMARDGLFFSRLSQVSKGARVPVWAISIQALWASVLATSGTFDQLTNLVVFGLWIFYGLTAASVFVLRRKMPNVPRPYRTFGYPLVPLMFILVAAWLVINTIQTTPVESVLGLMMIALGLPFYFFFRLKRGHERRLELSKE